MPTSPQSLDSLWAHHNAELRDPHQVVSQWANASEVDPQLLRHSVRGRFWEALAGSGQTLIVTREYEHLVVALSVAAGKPRISYLRLPHPNGLAVDAKRGILFIASTRNPNLIFEFAPWSACVQRDGHRTHAIPPNVLLPVRSRYYPGCLYIHDIALIGGRLHANAVSMNAIVELPECGGFKRVWWPKSIHDKKGGAFFGRNYLQLNSIAAGKTLAESFFSASAAVPSARRPGHLNFPVDGRGVIFSGKTREPIATGLTRPHSARFHNRELWVDNSGYGEVGRIVGGGFETVARLNGWTRGLCFGEDFAFVGTSRVIPRYKQYAPGVDLEKSQTGVHALDVKSGKVAGSILWPRGNQIFALELCRGLKTSGFPFSTGVSQKVNQKRIQQLFFAGLT